MFLIKEKVIHIENIFLRNSVGDKSIFGGSFLKINTNLNVNLLKT